MKTAIHLTDLHLEANRSLFDFSQVLPNKIADYVFLTGDIAGGTHSLPLIKYLVNLGYKVFYVLGNHEFYGHDVDELIAEWRDISSKIENFYFLENDSVVIDDTEFFGASLWTSLGTKKATEQIDPILRLQLKNMKDFEYIKNWTPEKMKNRFYDSFLILSDKIKKSKAKNKILLCHHLPSFYSLGNRGFNDPLNNMYATELGNFIAEGYLDFIFHGHIHEKIDYMLCDTRVMCNPFGYNDLNMKNKEFVWDSVIILKNK